MMILMINEGGDIFKFWYSIQFK